MQNGVIKILTAARLLRLHLFTSFLLIMQSVGYTGNFEYRDYKVGYDNIYFLQEKFTTDRYMRETVLKDTIFDGYKWLKIRSCMLQKSTDSCLVGRYTQVFNRREEYKEIGGVRLAYQYSKNEFTGAFDSSRSMYFPNDTSFTDEGRDVTLEHLAKCSVGGSTFDSCYRFSSKSNSSSSEIYFAKKFGLLQTRQFGVANDPTYYSATTLLILQPLSTHKRNSDKKQKAPEYYMNGRPSNLFDRCGYCVTR